MIYYICGHRGCGKNFLANQLAESLPVKIIDTGPIIRKVYKKNNGKEQSFKEWITGNEKKYGKNFSNELICRMSQIEEKQDYIIIGYRSLQGIEYFNKFFNVQNYRIIFIDGDYELFRSNFNKREASNISREEYGKIVEIENSMGIKNLEEFTKNNKKVAEYYYKTKNDNSIYEKVRKNWKKPLIEEMER